MSRRAAGRISDKILFDMAVQLKYFLLVDKSDDEALGLLVRLLKTHITDVVTLRRFFRAFDVTLQELDTTLNRDGSLVVLRIFGSGFTGMVRSFEEFKSLLLDLDFSTRGLYLKILGAKIDQLITDKDCLLSICTKLGASAQAILLHALYPRLQEWNFSFEEVLELCASTDSKLHRFILKKFKAQWISRDAAIMRARLAKISSCVGKVGCQYILDSLGPGKLREIIHTPKTLMDFLVATQHRSGNQVLMLAALGRHHLKHILTAYCFARVFTKNLDFSPFWLSLYQSYTVIRVSEPDSAPTSPLAKVFNCDRSRKLQAAFSAINSGGELPRQCRSGFLGLIYNATRPGRTSSSSTVLGK